MSWSAEALARLTAMSAAQLAYCGTNGMSAADILKKIEARIADGTYADLAKWGEELLVKSKKGRA